MNNIQRGDHLVSPRTGYSHHGIYLGKNQIIHYTGFSNSQHHGVIAITSLEEFCQGEGFTVQTYPFRLYSLEECAERACSRLGEDWYDVLLNNCEHFVTWCILGIHSSHQINRLIAAAALTRKLLTSEVAQETARQLTQTCALVAAQTAGRTTAIHAAGTVMGIAAGTGVATGSTVIPALVTGITAGAAAPLGASIGVSLAVGYGVKKLVDWVWD